jgi:hypothetical protein
MDVEVTIEAAKGNRAVWPYRVVEMLGLLVLLYGLASREWLIAAAGAVVMCLTYTVYRRRHPAQRNRRDRDGSSAGHDAVDSGGDGDGGGGD